MEPSNLLFSIGADVIGANEVHVWTTSLELCPSELASLWRVLAKDERERARRYRFDIDRRRFIAARGRLRQVLGCYLHILPGDVAFHYGGFGKPALAAASTALQFNLSHAGAWALIAVGQDRSLGIDVERVHDNLRWDDLAPSVFTSREQEELAHYPTHEKPNAFLRGWTRKEAYIKARGEGLSRSLDTFQVPLTTMKAPTMISSESDGATARQWWLYPLDPPPASAAALVAEGPPVRLQQYQWPDQEGRNADSLPVRSTGPVLPFGNTFMPLASRFHEGSPTKSRSLKGG